MPHDAQRPAVPLRLTALPAELTPALAAGARVVVIDVLRASTTIVAALDAGAEGVVPVRDVEAARAAAAARPGAILAGERGGLPPAGFDLGNSPLNVTPDRVRGRLVVLTTTNGTATLDRAADAAMVVIACYRNLGAVAAALATADDRPIVLACGGNDGRPALEDIACAGAIVGRLAGLAPDRFDPDAPARDATAAAAALPDPLAVFEVAPHARRLVALGLARDLAPCAALDASTCVPIRAPDGVLRPDRKGVRSVV